MEFLNLFRVNVKNLRVKEVDPAYKYCVDDIYIKERKVDSVERLKRVVEGVAVIAHTMSMVAYSDSTKFKKIVEQFKEKTEFVRPAYRRFEGVINISYGSLWAMFQFMAAVGLFIVGKLEEVDESELPFEIPLKILVPAEAFEELFVEMYGYSFKWTGRKFYRGYGGIRLLEDFGIVRRCYLQRFEPHTTRSLMFIIDFRKFANIMVDLVVSSSDDGIIDKKLLKKLSRFTGDNIVFQKFALLALGDLYSEIGRGADDNEFLRNANARAKLKEFFNQYREHFRGSEFFRLIENVERVIQKKLCVSLKKFVRYVKKQFEVATSFVCFYTLATNVDAYIDFGFYPVVNEFFGEVSHDLIDTIVGEKEVKKKIKMNAYREAVLKAMERKPSPKKVYELVAENCPALPKMRPGSKAFKNFCRLIRDLTEGEQFKWRGARQMVQALGVDESVLFKRFTLPEIMEVFERLNEWKERGYLTNYKSLVDFVHNPFTKVNATARRLGAKAPLVSPFLVAADSNWFDLNVRLHVPKVKIDEEVFEFAAYMFDVTLPGVPEFDPHRYAEFVKRLNFFCDFFEFCKAHEEQLRLGDFVGQYGGYKATADNLIFDYLKYLFDEKYPLRKYFNLEMLSIFAKDFNEYLYHRFGAYTYSMPFSPVMLVKYYSVYQKAKKRRGVKAIVVLRPVNEEYVEENGTEDDLHGARLKGLRQRYEPVIVSRKLARKMEKDGLAVILK